MSQQALRAAATGTAVAQAEPQKPKTLSGLLMDPQVKAQMAMALPRHMTADRLARIALTEIRKTPKLATCDQASFLGAIMQCAQLGLEPGSALGHAYLLPFDKREKVGNQWQVTGTDVQLIVGYRGMIDLARRSGQILSLEARAVFEADEFFVRLGLDSTIEHVPAWEAADRGPMTFVYAVAKLKDGGTQFEVMSRAEVIRIRDASQGYKSAAESAKKYNKPINSPWEQHFEEMAKKTVIRRLFKYLPVSIEMQRAVGLDEMGDAGIDQMHRAVIETPDFARIEAPTGADSGTGEITAAEILKSINEAPDRDALDAAADLMRLLPADEQPAVSAAYEKRIAELAT